MKTTLLTLLTIFTLSNISFGQGDTLYAVNNWGGAGNDQIIRYTGIDPVTGVYSGTTVGFTTGVTSEALALTTDRVIYFIPESDNQGEFTIQSTVLPADGSAPAQPTEVYSGDLNGASTTAIAFRRMAARKDGTVYLVVTDDESSSTSSSMRLAKFTSSPTGAVTNFTDLGTITLSDGGLPNLFNGDLAFDDAGNMFILTNQSNTGGETRIYKVSAATLAGATGPGSTTMFHYAWTVQYNGENLGSISTGLAATSSGNFYISAQGGSGNGAGVQGIFLLNATLPSGKVNVIATNITNSNMLGDLATVYFPVNHVLPVTFGPVKGKIVNDALQVNWTTLNEKNASHFEIWASKDAKEYVKVGEVNSKAVNGDSSQTLSYSYSLPLNEATGLMGVSVFAFGLLGLFLSRRNKLLMVLVAFVGLGVTSCSRDAQQIDINNDGKLFIKIVEIAKDGSKTTSDVTVVYKAD